MGLMDRLRHLAREQWDKRAPGYYSLHGKVARLTRRQPSYIVESFEGDDPCRGNPLAAVFTHFDARGTVHDYVVEFVKALKEAGYRVYFMSNTKALPKAGIDRLRPLCAMIHRRDNKGYDFGAYKDGILSLPDRDGLERLIVTNDSVYGPFGPLGPLLERMDPTKAEVWGLTDTYEKRYHLQSYFVAFTRTAIQHPAFTAFWRDLPYADARGFLINHGEVALTQRMLGAGLRTRALFPYEETFALFKARAQAGWDAEQAERLKDIEPLPKLTRAFTHTINVSNIADGGIPLNPTHFFWDILIAEQGYPFIKRDLLQLNPATIPELSRWRELIEKRWPYDTEIIARHQRMRLRNRSI